MTKPSRRARRLKGARILQMSRGVWRYRVGKTAVVLISEDDEKHVASIETVTGMTLEAIQRAQRKGAQDGGAVTPRAVRTYLERFYTGHCITQLSNNFAGLVVQVFCEPPHARWEATITTGRKWHGTLTPASLQEVKVWGQLLEMEVEEGVLASQSMFYTRACEFVRIRDGAEPTFDRVASLLAGAMLFAINTFNQAVPQDVVERFKQFESQRGFVLRGSPGLECLMYINP